MGIPDKQAGMMFVWKYKVTVDVTQSLLSKTQQDFLLWSPLPGISFAPHFSRVHLSPDSPILLVKHKAMDILQGWLPLSRSSFSRKVHGWANLYLLPTSSLPASRVSRRHNNGLRIGSKSTQFLERGKDWKRKCPGHRPSSWSSSMEGLQRK